MDLLDLLVDVFTENGYAAVFIVLLVCGFGVPVPEDITLIAGGVIAGLGYANVHLMCVVGLVGVLAGDAAMFMIGRHLGPHALRQRWVALLLTPRRYARVQKKFARYGSRLMFVARFLPGLRSPIYLTAGMTRQISFRRFLLLDGLAALISVPLWVYLGFYGALNHEWLLLWIKRSKIGVGLILAAIVLIIIAIAWQRTRRRRLLRRLRASRATARQATRPREPSVIPPRHPES